MSTKVLFIDDEKSVLSSIQRLLHKEDYGIKVTDDPDEVLELLKPGDIAVIVSDQRMPRIEGTHLLEKAKEISPDTVRIILTGYADIAAVVEAINRGAAFRFLTKPWNDDELRLTIRQAVAQYELLQENKRLSRLTEEQNRELKDLNQNLERKVFERTGEITKLNEKLKVSFLGSVRVMGQMAELHSPLIGSHSKRVSELCRKVASEMKLPEDEVFQIEMAAILHDIGKVEVPSAVLNKPEELLKAQDRELLMNHPVQGQKIIGTVLGLAQAAMIVRYHHEKFDGTGYPNGLKGESIPWGSRLIAVVDTYDKILNNRARFASVTPFMALNTVEARCPEFFDRDIVQLLKEVIINMEKAGIGFGEAEVGPRDLIPGMVLSRPLRTSQNILLLPRDCCLEKAHIERIIKFHESDPVIGCIYVYRGKVEKPGNASSVSAGR